MLSMTSPEPGLRVRPAEENSPGLNVPKKRRPVLEFMVASRMAVKRWRTMGTPEKTSRSATLRHTHERE